MNEWMENIEFEHDDDWEATTEYLDAYDDYANSENYE